MFKPLITLVAGARPNFMKIAPIVRVLEEKRDAVAYEIVHTGQHYDSAMSDVFFEQLGIPEPNNHLEAGSGTHAEQTARVMIGFEKYCMEKTPDLVIVVGDVNSTLGCSVVAKKLCIKVAHVEAGLRSGDLTMPEEINRLVTDSISDYFFVTERSGLENLLSEGKDNNCIFFVGHVMIDNLLFQFEKLKDFEFSNSVVRDLKAELPKYGVLTLHRPSNVDDVETLKRLVDAVNRISETLPIIFPAHPRTRNRMDQAGAMLNDSVHVLDPLPYMEFLNIWKDASLVITDSGGLQEETTALGVPCLTVRENTERPITIECGTNRLVGSDPDVITAACYEILNTEPREYQKPELWDGRAAERTVDELLAILS